jgi:hypothetical protein
MPPEMTVMLWSRMDDPQHRRVQRVELSTTKIRPNRRNRRALLTAYRVNAPIQGETGLVSETIADLSGFRCVPYLFQKLNPHSSAQRVG